MDWHLARALMFALVICLAVFNTYYCTSFPFLTLLPWGVLLYRHGGESTPKDKLLQSFIYVAYYAIILWPIAAVFPYMNYQLLQLWIYMPLLLFVGRFQSENKWYRLWVGVFWNPPLLIGTHIVSRLGGRVWAPLISVVTNDIALGPLPTEREIIDLYKQPYNVRGIVNMCDESLGPIVKIEEYKMGYLHLPTLDCTTPSVTQFEKGVRFIDEFVKAKRKKGSNLGSKDRIFIHCKAGQGRSAAMALCWLIYSGMNSSDAMDLLTKCRSAVVPTITRSKNVIQFIEKQK